jgi:predicted ATPase/DNA-binding CsgD family transcriptional regulator
MLHEPVRSRDGGTRSDRSSRQQLVDVEGVPLVDDPTHLGRRATQRVGPGADEGPAVVGLRPLQGEDAVRAEHLAGAGEELTVSGSITPGRGRRPNPDTVRSGEREGSRHVPPLEAADGRVEGEAPAIGPRVAKPYLAPSTSQAEPLAADQHWDHLDGERRVRDDRGLSDLVDHRRPTKRQAGDERDADGRESAPAAHTPCPPGGLRFTGPRQSRALGLQQPLGHACLCHDREAPRSHRSVLLSASALTTRGSRGGGARHIGQLLRTLLISVRMALPSGGPGCDTRGARVAPGGRAVVTESGEQRTSFLGPGLSTFVGREREIEDLTGLVESARLVTLVGPGGSGKTRLALEAAERFRGTDGRQVDVAELAALRDPALVPAAIAQALGLRATGSEAPFELVARHVGRGDQLLVLDNLEQLLPGAAATLAELLGRCPALRLLVTSRVPLNLRAEHVFRVEPLPVPGTDANLEELSAVPSVALFLERARASGSEVRPDPVAAGTIAAICRRLDGLPLAIELAAPRLRLLSPTALLARLEEGLGVLAGGPLDVPDRQRTLRDTIAWSVELLPAREAALFGRLGVFRGGFDLAAALAVAAPGIVDTEDELLEALSVLVDHSLVRVAQSEGTPRFAMLETIREYAREHLDDEPILRDRHLAHYLALAEEAAARLEGPGRKSMARRIEDEAQNLRAALGWAEVHARAADMLRLTAALGFYWREHGDLREGRDWLERAAALAGPDPSAPLAQTLIGLSRIVMVLGDRRHGQILADQALAVASAVGDTRDVGRALFYRAIGMVDEGRLDVAAASLERALAVARECVDAALISYCLLMLGKVAWHQRDHEGARRYYEESAAVGRESGDPVRMSIPLIKLGRLCMIAFGDVRGGLEHLESAVALLRETDARDYLGLALLDLGQARLRLGQLEQARSDAREGLALLLRTASPDDLIEALETMAEWLGTVGSNEAALRAWAADERAREDLGSSFSPGERAWMEPLWARERREMGEQRASLAWEAGRSQHLTEAVAAAREAMEHADPSAARPRLPDPRGAALTHREVEVLALLGRGCSDGEIAERLFISKKTASVHVANIKGKLDTENRVETALAAVQMGLVPRTG